ncbi:MAG TPA: hypothetical protein VM510_15390, partial [Caulifigura sp.]|nr:hypothetical protein [Caulifigura sp.]
PCLATGCSSNAPPPIPAAADQVVTGADADVKQVKQWLDLIAKSGEGGSSLDGLKEAIDKLQIDASKKDALTKELAVLSKTNDPAKIKASAAKMSGML